MPEHTSKELGERASQVSLADFTNVTFEAVLRAIDVRNAQVEDQLKIRGPIIYGIWFEMPDIFKEGGPGGPVR
jgi:hypothetical protein